MLFAVLFKVLETDEQLNTENLLHWELGWGRAECPELVLRELGAAVQRGYERAVWGGVETGGLLFGDREDHNTSIRGLSFIDSEHEYGPAYHLSELDQKTFANAIEAAQKEAEVLGWWRSTSRSLELTEEDRAVTERHFQKKWQVVLVVERGQDRAPRFGLFARESNGKLQAFRPVAEFALTPEEQTDGVSPESEGSRSGDGAVTEPPTPDVPTQTTVEPENAQEPVAEPTSNGSEGAVSSLVKPFHLTPDCRFYYEGASYREAWAKLSYGIESRKGLIALTGHAGTGKTMLLEFLAAHLTTVNIPFAFVSHAQIDAKQFYDWVAGDLALAPGNKMKVLINLQDKAVRQVRAGSTVALLLDNAHELSEDVLLEIKLLNNIESRTGKLIQVVLSGRPELDEKLCIFDLRGLRQRIAMRAHLEAFGPAESKSYIERRLEAAEMLRQYKFNSDALRAIYELTAGNPREINLLCGDALEHALKEHLPEISEPIVRRMAKKTALYQTA